MFKHNVGTVDRMVRIVLGLALLAGFALNTDAAYRWLYLIGIIPLLTGLFGTCGIYSLFGINTCRMKS